MNWKQIATATVAATMVAGLATEAQSGRLQRARRAVGAGSSVEAVAALSAVGGASGWGRVKVEDSSRSGMTKRQVGVELFELDPNAEFTVEIDGIVIGSVRSDGLGWASLKLESPDDEHPPVPAGLPGAADLLSATVFDMSGAFVLVGDFNSLDTSGGASLHEEKISLADPSGLASGIAKVERSESGKQEFDTRATGLTAGDSFTVQVDGFVAGMVTADVVGQARLSLEAPDDENPLPPELQPIEDLRLVEWLDTAGTVVLTGSFTGVSNDDDGEDEGAESFEGEITALAVDGFTLQSGMMTLTVVVTADTVYEDVAGLADLMVGDMVEAEGTLVDTTLTAMRVELKSVDTGGGEDEGAESFDGEITALAVDGFTLQSGMMTLTVVVTADTVYEDVAGLADLMVGDMVEAEGTLVDTTLTAMRVELKNVDTGGGEDEGAESFEGEITALAVDGFTLQSGMMTLTVVVTADTVYEDVAGLADLMVGDMVEAEGTLVDTTLTAMRVELKSVDTGGGEDEGGETSVEGTVTAVGADSVTLDTSDGPLTAVVTADTELRHFSDLSELQAGDFVEVKGTWTGGSFIADRIELNP